jgi:DUF4097 and DUF4098 domain-containing protein YvlB
MNRIFSIKQYLKMKRITITFALVLTSLIVVQAQDIMAQSELRAENVNSVSIEGSFCDVEITKGSDVYFKGVIMGNGDDDLYEFETRIEGEQLVIKVNKRRNEWMTNISKSLIELTVPDNVPVSVRNSSGDIRIEDVSAREYYLQATSGSITAEDIGGQLEVKATSGDIRINNLGGDRHEIQTTSGGIEIDQVKGDVVFQATSGDVMITGMTGNLRGKTTSGEMELNNITGGIELQATSGDIEGVNMNITSDSEFKTTSGEIEIRLASALTNYSFDIDTSSGDIEVGSRSAEDEYYEKSGQIWIRAKATSGDVSFRD